jgi:integrase
MPDWLDKPIAELRGADMLEVYDRVVRGARQRAGSANPTGTALANRLVRQVSAIWNSLDRVHELPGRNPTRAVVKQEMVPRSTRINDGDFPAWYAVVQTLSPVRRDLQVVALFTGIRSDGIRHVRWEHVDEARGTLLVARAKGNQPYVVPLSATCLDILARRRRDNMVEFAGHGGDHGWLFPSLTRARPHKVIPVAEPKEARLDKTTGRKVRLLPGLHDLRRSFGSVALEIGIERQDREALMNHAGQGVNERHYSIRQRLEYLAECQTRIEAALWERIRPRVGLQLVS